ncbi:hypothetical protein AMECASPLE_012940, partial [Ameca splendens]
SVPCRVRSGGKRSGRTRISDTPNHLTLRIRILEDSETKVLSKAVFQKSSVSVLECPRGLQELDFMDLLRSTFPQLAAGQPFDIFIAAKNRQLQSLSVKTLTPEEICSNHRSSGNLTLYIRLGKREDPPAADPGVMKSDETGLHEGPIHISMDQTEMGENGVDPGNDAEDDNWNPDPEPQTAKRTRKTKEKSVLRRTGESKMSCKMEKHHVLDPSQSHQMEKHHVLDPSQSHQMEKHHVLDPSQSHQMEKHHVLDPSQIHQMEEDPVPDSSEA